VSPVSPVSVVSLTPSMAHGRGQEDKDMTTAIAVSVWVAATALLLGVTLAIGDAFR